MRRDVSKSQIDWLVDLDREEWDAFAHLYPMRGSGPFVATTALSALLNALESNHGLHTAATTDFLHYRSDAKPRRIHTLSIKLPTALYLRFDRLFPQWGATTWIIRRLFHHAITQPTLPSIQLQALGAVEQYITLLHQQSMEYAVVTF
jgi:hypothetical protein